MLFFVCIQLLFFQIKMAGVVSAEEEEQGWWKFWKAIFITRDGLEGFVDREIKLLFSDATKPGHNLIDDIEQSHCLGKIGTNGDKLKLQQSPCEIEVAKCFIHAQGYKDKTTIKDIDLNGILSIISNCTRFHNYFLNWQKKTYPPAVFKKVTFIYLQRILLR